MSSNAQVTLNGWIINENGMILSSEFLLDAQNIYSHHDTIIQIVNHNGLRFSKVNFVNKLGQNEISN